MNKRLFVVGALLAFTSAVAACSSSDAKTSSNGTTDAGSTTGNASSNSSSSSNPAPSNDAGSSSAAATPTGTVATKAFTVASAVAHVNDADGTIDLVFSNQGSLCASLTAGKTHAGETTIELDALEGTVPGTFTTTEARYSSVATTCASGTTLDDTSIAASSDATTVNVTIATKTDSTVTGTIDLAFDDGSTVKGSFTATVCSGQLGDTVTCY